MEKEMFSFSKLTTFHTCPYSYYRTYIKKDERKDNVYSYLGGNIHSILEELQKKKHIDINELRRIGVEKFNDSVLNAEILDFSFPTEKSGKNFVECMELYFKNYTPLPCDKEVVEEYFEFDIAGITLRGYIDLYTITGNNIDIYDYKSSSKFSKLDLETKGLQLVIYALALQKKYPEYKIRSLNFDMCKYTLNERGTLKERNTIDTQDKKALVKIPFNDNWIKKAKDFIENTINEINSINPLIEKDWKPKVNKFFCQNICSNIENCQKGRFA